MIDLLYKNKQDAIDEGSAKVDSLISQYNTTIVLSTCHTTADTYLSTLGNEEGVGEMKSIPGFSGIIDSCYSGIVVLQPVFTRPTSIIVISCVSNA